MVRAHGRHVRYAYPLTAFRKLYETKWIVLPYIFLQVFEHGLRGLIVDDAIVQLLHGVDFSAGTHARERTRHYLDLVQHDRPTCAEACEGKRIPLSDTRLGMLAAAGDPFVAAAGDPFEMPAQPRS